MNAGSIPDSFKEMVSESISLFSEGVDRYKIFSPFHFDDGDHFVMILKKEHDNGWIITDEGNTYMHMSLKMDLALLEHQACNEIIEDSLKKYRVNEREGELFVNLADFQRAGITFF